MALNLIELDTNDTQINVLISLFMLSLIGNKCKTIYDSYVFFSWYGNQTDQNNIFLNQISNIYFEMQMHLTLDNNLARI